MSSASSTTYSRDQLHGRACINCGNTEGPFLPAGHVTTEGTEGPLPWAVVACPGCQEEE